MLSLSIAADEPLKVLCLGAHCDDIEIGCSGTLMTLQDRYPQASFDWVVFSSDDERAGETRRAAQAIHGKHPRVNVEVLTFRGSYFPYEGAQIKDHFERVKARVQPNLVLTHFLQDRHQDHRVVSELTWNTFRNHLVLEYEIPKYEGDLAHPNVYVPLTRDIVNRKADMLMECFPSQHARAWFSRDLFVAHLRLRGIECNAPSGHAEALHARKVTL
jgi:LmbE family N-acetylglucosaminyl deacetylase